jgi:hypothetical protein
MLLALQKQETFRIVLSLDGLISIPRYVSARAHDGCFDSPSIS